MNCPQGIGVDVVPHVLLSCARFLKGLPGNNQGADRSVNHRKAHPKGRPLQIKANAVCRSHAYGE